MSQRHYQVIILGDSLASRLAGVLLSKRGVRVLSLQSNGLGGGLWFQPSLLLERILDHLGGRSCYTTPLPLQIITAQSRLELHGPYPLEEELRREFPADHERVSLLLQQLAQIADRLEDRLWQIGSLPLYGLASRLRYRWQRSGARGLDRPLLSLFGDFAGTPAGETLTALFAGLAQAPIEGLTVGEGALLWGGAIQGRSVSPSGLDTLLRHRFEQFNGESENLGAVQALSVQGGRLTDVVLKSGARCSAERFVIDAPEVWPLLPEEWRQGLPASAAPAVYTATLPEARLSPLLAPRLLLGGVPPLRLSLVLREGVVQCSIKAPRLADRPIPSPESVASRLTGLFPFAGLEPQLQHPGTPPPQRRARAPFPGAALPLKLRSNLLLGHSPAVFPTLGTIGEVLTGLSSANYLLRELKQR